jgi:hypothetical protein
MGDKTAPQGVPVAQQPLQGKLKIKLNRARNLKVG